MDEIAPGYVGVGRVLGAWGVRGELKVEPLAPESALESGKTVSIAGRDYAIQRCNRSGRLLRLKLARVDTRGEAQALRGLYLQAQETELLPLPEGKYYHFQLVGLTVRSLDERDLGRVVDVLSTPENDVYVVKGSLGEFLVPAVDDVVRAIDLTRGIITVDVIPGLLPWRIS